PSRWQRGTTLYAALFVRTRRPGMARNASASFCPHVGVIQDQRAGTFLERYPLGSRSDGAISNRNQPSGGSWLVLNDSLDSERHVSAWALHELGQGEQAHRGTRCWRSRRERAVARGLFRVWCIGRQRGADAARHRGKGEQPHLSG